MIKIQDVKKVFSRFAVDNHIGLAKVVREVYSADAQQFSLYNLLIHFYQTNTYKDHLAVRVMKQLLRIEDKCEEDEANAILTSLEILHKASLFNKQNVDLLIKHRQITTLSQVIQLLNRARLLGQASYEQIASHLNIVHLCQAIKYLLNSRIMSIENYNFISAHEDPYSLSMAFDSLARSQILNDDNRRALFALERPVHIAFVMVFLQGVGLLTQANLDKLLNESNRWLISELAIQRVWMRIPSTRFTQEVFIQLLYRMRQNTVENYVDLLVQQTVANDTTNHLNPPQSTHTSSVHRTTSASIQKMHKRYEHLMRSEILLSEAYCCLVNMVQSLPSTLQQEAALRFLARLLGPDYEYQDAATGVTIKQFLAIIFFAINDKDARLGTLQDAQECLIEGFYEIQRGYNLSDKGVDDLLDDRPICVGGTFNKLIEKLVGVHPDCGIEYVTPHMASAKLPIIVKEELMRYLDHKIHNQSSLCIQSTIDDLAKIRANEFVTLWPLIKTQVQDRLYEEFHDLYIDREDPQLQDLLTHCEYVDVAEINLKPIDEKLTRAIISSGGISAPSMYLMLYGHKRVTTDTSEKNASLHFTSREKCRSTLLC